MDESETSFGKLHKSARHAEVKPLIATETSQPHAVSFLQALRIPVSQCCLFSVIIIIIVNAIIFIVIIVHTIVFIVVTSSLFA